jgi:NAD(P)H-hydrate epimerase
MKIVNVDEMRRIEQAADQAGQSYEAMMDMAGQAVASIAEQVMLPEPESDILVLVGPGNNGGDGLVAARRLLDLGHRVVVYVWKRDIKGMRISGCYDAADGDQHRADNGPVMSNCEETRHAALIIGVAGYGVAPHRGAWPICFMW